MKVEKEGKFLVFTNDDNDILKYDFSTNTYIKNGKKIKYPQNYFRGYSLEKVFETSDEKYKNLFTFISEQEERCKNIGTFLQRIKDYSTEESWIMIGVNVVRGIYKKPNEVNKDILKIIKKYNLIFNRDFSRVVDNELLINCLKYMDFHNVDEKYLLSLISDFDYRENFICLSNYNYEYKSLIDYLIKIDNYEAVDMRDSLGYLKDYATMQTGMSKDGKFEKYPKCLHTTHDIISRNFSSFKKEYNDVLFNNMVDNSLEYLDKNYSIFTPKCSQDIKDEGVNLRHCVGSYVDKIIDGKCQVVFMRKDKNDSLVTIEIQNNKIVQAKGELNRNLYENELTFLHKYAKIKQLDIKI